MVSIELVPSTIKGKNSKTVLGAQEPNMENIFKHIYRFLIAKFYFNFRTHQEQLCYNYLRYTF